MSLLYTMRYRIAERINPRSVVGLTPPERLADAKGSDEPAEPADVRWVRPADKPDPARHQHEHQHNPPDEHAVIDAVIRHTLAGEMKWSWLTGRHLQATYKGRVMHYNSKDASLEIVVQGERNIDVAIPTERMKLFHDTVMNLGDQREQQVRNDVYRHFTG